MHHCATLQGLAKKINVGHGAPASDMHFTRLSLPLSLRLSLHLSLCLTLRLSISRCGVCQKAELTWAISLPAVQGVTTLKLISLVKFYVYVTLSGGERVDTHQQQTPKCSFLSSISSSVTQIPCAAIIRLLYQIYDSININFQP